MTQRVVPIVAETIKAAAIRCKHCHANLTPRPETRSEQPRPGPDSMSGSLISSAFSYGWKCFTENIGLLIGVHVFVGLFGVLSKGLIRRWRFGFGYAYRPLWIVIAILGALFTAWLTVGVLKINLAIIDGRSASFPDLFSGSDRLGSYLGATLLVSILVGIGTMLLVVPGIILAVSSLQRFSRSINAAY